MNTNCESINAAAAEARQALDDSPNNLFTTFRVCKNEGCGVRAYCKKRQWGDIQTEMFVGLKHNIRVIEFVAALLSRIVNRYEEWLTNPLPSPTPPCGLNVRQYQPGEKPKFIR